MRQGSKTTIQLIVYTLAILACTHFGQAWAEAVFAVEQLVAGFPAVAPIDATILIRDGDRSYRANVQNLRTFIEVQKRLGEVAKIPTTLGITIDREANAAAIPLPKHNLIVVTSGMLDLVGSDVGMIASLLGHEYAHHHRKHTLKTLMKLPEFVDGAIAVGESIGSELGSRQMGNRAASVAFGLMGAAFSREQEFEADKVGTELMSDAKYEPNGTLRLITTMLKVYGGRPTGYFDSHPGLKERLSNAGSTVLNQQYDSVASTLKDRKDWRGLRPLVEQWLQISPDSARAWYYKGLALKASKRTALSAFEKAVEYDSNFLPARAALCTELFTADQERASLVCAELLPKNDDFDDYVAKTFASVVHVGGMHPQRIITARDMEIVRQATQR